MRIFISILLSLAFVTGALAHPGHIEALGGHDHFVLIGAAALAIVIGLGAYIGVRAKR